MEELHISRKVYIPLLLFAAVVTFVFLCYILFFKQKVVLESKSPYQPYSLQVITYGTGFFNRETSYIYYKISDKTVAKEKFTSFEIFDKNIYVVWEPKRDPEGPSLSEDGVLLIMNYAKHNFQGEVGTKTAKFHYDSVKSK
ncbi:hypothetical protein SFC65_19215 [Priestia filamentosa]|uniref:hypothetical protein n=1 Tax=Priestia filamentosa TaxID=1402861 RepID=UPI003981DBAB